MAAGLMSSSKRKAAAYDRPAKKAKSSRNSTDEPIVQQATKSAVASSILQQQDRAFPRGGASVLTPLEQKQIKAEAERDALFESQTGQTSDGPKKDVDLFEDAGRSTTSATRRHRKSKKNATETSEGKSLPSIKIAGLSYKNLMAGSVVLGQVTGITSKDVALALPNNLTGFVSLTSISDRLNIRINSLLADEDMVMEEDGDSTEDIDLQKLFYIGQWLRANVITSHADDHTETTTRSKRHIELSLDPVAVNNHLSPKEITTSNAVQASVRSVEDHGLIMDLGLSDSNVKGFISKKELGAAFQLDAMQEGQVLMCIVTGKGSDGSVIKLSPDPSKFYVSLGRPDVKALALANDVATVGAILPGTVVDVLISESGPGGVVGKVIGLLDVTADVVHSGAFAVEDMERKFKIGSKVKGRILWTTLTLDGAQKVGVSFLDNLLMLLPPREKLPETASNKMRLQAEDFQRHLSASSIIEHVKVTSVIPNRGIFLLTPSATDRPERLCFAHISQISDSRLDSISSTTGAYRLGSVHTVRVMSHNPVDNLYYVTLKDSILKQRYLRIEDLSVGEVAEGTVDRLILGGKTGITGVLVKLSDNVVGLVPEMHFSDSILQHPDRKFREGMPVKARVLSVDTEKRQFRLTLKKALVTADDDQIWTDYQSVAPGMEGIGTVINIVRAGAVLQFFSKIRAWLPVAEMSETFIENPETYLRLGQTLNVKVLQVDSSTEEMKVTCKSNDPLEGGKQQVWENVTGGQLVSGSVLLKTVDSVTVGLESGINGIVRVAHLVDGSASKSEHALKRIRMGQKLSDLLVLDKLERSKHLQLTYKPSMIEDAKRGDLLKTFEDAKAGSRVHGFVRNVTPEGVYVEFASGFVGMVPKSQVTADMASEPAFGLRKDQSITAWVLNVNAIQHRITLSLREQKEDVQPHEFTARTTKDHAEGLPSDVESSIAPLPILELGKLLNAKIASVRGTQLNVRFGDNAHGRIDVSEAFDSWDDIKSKKAPLQQFKQDAHISCVIIGIHDARNHRFLPISHRQSRVPVYELSAKSTRVVGGNEELLTMDSVNEDTTYVAFINNYGDNCVWVNLSPSVRGRINLMDLSDDAGRLQDLNKHFPIGCAVKVRVKHVNAISNKLDLTARVASAEKPLDINSISPGMILPARITKIGERSVTVQLSDDLAAPVPLVELNDNFELAMTANYAKNDIVRVCVLDCDVPNKRLYLSLRPSKVLSSSMNVADPHVMSYDQLRIGDLVRGFVKHVGDKGVIISLGGRIDALVRISDLTDEYVKDWRSIVGIDQLVKGRIVSVEPARNQVLISLKASQVDKDYIPPSKIEDIEVGGIVTGKVRKVEDFGAFIDIDNTSPRLSGLCHRSEVATKKVEDVRKFYSAGDKVKAKVLSVDIENRKISLGLKASYFSVESDDIDEESDGGVQVDGSDEDEQSLDDSMSGEDRLNSLLDTEAGGDDDASESEQSRSGDFADVDTSPQHANPLRLKTNGFDWTGGVMDAPSGTTSDSEVEDLGMKKRKRTKPTVQEDRTGDLDRYGPQNTSDYERQLLGEPNNANLWIQYMAFQLQSGELHKAREVAQRALTSIHIREQEEKGRVWIAWLNLEVEYGDHDRVEDVFKQACSAQDPLEMHETLASIYIRAGKNSAAEDVYERIIGNKVFRGSSEIWTNYATFLIKQLNETQRARALLPKALQSVPVREHMQLTAKFAALEFKLPHGDPERGRTVFEGLVSEFPKWTGGWDSWVDLEKARVAHLKKQEERRDAKEKVRALYQRIAGSKMKARRAMYVFKGWEEFERTHGDQKGIAKARQTAEEWTMRARELKEA